MTKSTVDKKAMGVRIRDARKNLGLTQERLAEKLNIVSSYLTLIEQGNRNVSTETLVALSKNLGLSTDYLLKGDIADGHDISTLQWQSLTAGRTEQEINSALKVVLEFFKAIDDCE